MSQQPTSTPDPIAQARSNYEAAEKRLAAASEELVSSEAFAEGLAMLTSNVVAVSKVVSTAMDQVVRITRFAGRNDVTNLGRQLARTEDKLEHVLQVVERLEDELAATRAELDKARGGTPAEPASKKTTRPRRPAGESA